MELCRSVPHRSREKCGSLSVTDLFSSVNHYGDTRVLAGDDGHGIDVSTQRVDDLDMMALDNIMTRVECGEHVRVADLGCGHGGQTLRMWRAGATVAAIDIVDQHDHLTIGANNGIDCVKLDLRNIVVDRPQLPYAPWDIVYSQRTLHYLKWREAVDLLHVLRAEYMAQGGHLFLSVSGLNSELGGEYVHAAHIIDNRFSVLSPSMAQKHGIHAPVCLYSLDEAGALIAAAGFREIKKFASSFGNIKIVACVP